MTSAGSVDELGALVVDVYEDNCVDGFIVEHGLACKAAGEGAEVDEGAGLVAGDKAGGSGVGEEEPILKVANGQGGEFGGGEVEAVGEGRMAADGLNGEFG